MDVLAAGALTVLALLPTLGVVRWLRTRPGEPEDAQAYAIGVGAIASAPSSRRRYARGSISTSP